MEGTYDVIFGQRKVGRVQVTRQGLYYHFVCCCEEFTGQMYDLLLCRQGQTEKLGLLMPRAGHLELDARLPVKRAGQGDVRFQVRPKHAPMPDHFIPLHPQEPFAYLQRLESAYLVRREGQLGIVLREPQEL